ncbi:MAG: Two component regulator three Y domain protein [Proteobacteria bacterium]|nr:MAG: Two component regulator three Y domain protein [Pseudomonadota bacterium]
MKKFLVLILSLMFAFNMNVLAELMIERVALRALYDSTNGDSWTNNTNWKTTTSICDWYGVTCNEAGTNVIEIYLYNNNLAGSIPSEIGNLEYLELLNLSFNKLTGQIPSEIGELTKLKYLRLWDNKLTGPIPSEIGNLSELQDLSIRDNNLTGSIPSEIVNLTELYSILLYNNNLTGPIPSDIGNLSELKYLCLDGNNLTGQIPSSIVNLTKMTEDYLRLYNNCSLKTNEQSVIDFIKSKMGESGYQEILDTNGNCINLSPIYYLLLN